ncbi:uncharacterized protein TEOVI_000255700 [Trypanosoma equiperdum]|uniref:FAM13A-like domain-containing protein n=2 Tax=Trypanozoon TaxID=39700 RepID=Q38BJ3_TRYB2|nr:hypothetical protein, conserved [Trypanosoma brucei brucei TREU927]EAN77827.1 hypothetical protein, conserved [Trypanosoma brucei brucei TREU927]SCU70977.1 hypothetical protein, conserved [Trypanosoma equiperdum]
MDVRDQLMQAAAQTVDALSFTQTHVIDEDFRAHNRATIESVRSLQREQRSRIEQTYGPQSPSADVLALQLLSSYRGEITFLDHSRGRDGRTSPSAAAGVVTSLTHGQCLSFKKEMKQRIHEWERVFCEERGVAVTTRDKAMLRQVYELYKLAKNRLRGEESPTNGGGEDNNNLTNSQSQTQQPQGARSSSERANSAGTVTSGVRVRTPSPSGSQVDNPARRVVGSTTQPSGLQRQVVRSSTSSGLSANEGPGSTQPTIGSGIRVSQMSNEELAAEKRYLKRILHRFESDFEQRNGFAPTRNDRQAHSYEYIRYGELKNEIIRRMPSVAGG